MVQLVAWLVLAWLAVNALVIAVYRRELGRLWREPALRHPVLVIESDDWGAGPLAQAQALRAIAGVLARHRDAVGRPAVVSLALVLAVPDSAAIRSSGEYRRRCLDDPQFASILDALRTGRAQGAFALQLHGLEHYWPETLMKCCDPQVAAWLRQESPAATEDLPSHLQSRWVDATTLPSRSHAVDAIRAAAAEEAEVYRRVLGEDPKVVVPPTFVWTREVEAAWAGQGVECVVTPGWRYVLRDARGVPGGDEGPIANDDRGEAIGYLARCGYFEPLRGRDAVHALGVLDRVTAEGRPCLLENHRDNFIGETRSCQQSLDELDRLLGGALARQPGLRFLSSWELHCVLRDRDAEWLASTWRERWPAIWQRLRHSGRLWKLLRLTGAVSLYGLIDRWLPKR